MNFCQVYHLKREYKKAEDYGRAALNALIDERPKLKAIACRTLGIMAQEQGHLQQAEKYLQNAREFSVSPKEEALTLNVLAIIFQQQEQYDQALATYQELLARLDSDAHTILLVEVHLNKGSLLYDLEKLDEAAGVFKKAEKLLQQRPGLIYYKALTAHNLGCVWRDQNQFANAEASFRRSIQQFAQVGTEINEANAWGNLAKLYRQQTRQAEALECCNRALQLVAAYPDNALAQKLQNNYTRLRHESGRPG